MTERELAEEAIVALEQEGISDDVTTYLRNAMSGFVGQPLTEVSKRMVAEAFAHELEKARDDGLIADYQVDMALAGQGRVSVRARMRAQPLSFRNYVVSIAE